MPERDEGRIYIGELAEIINRKPNTIRGWERTRRLPKKLCSHRSDEGAAWRYWTPEQVEEIKEWVAQIPPSGLQRFTAGV
jgi:hypothetical protein